MRIYKKEFVARGFLIIVVSALLSMSLAISRHLVPQGLRQVITINHQIRRVLLRAERESLRSGVAIQKSRVMSSPAKELGEVPVFWKIVVARQRISLQPNRLSQQKDFILQLSPVLNI